VSLPSLLQGVKNTLAQERKCCLAIAHPFDELEFVHMALCHTIVLGESQSCYNGGFVLDHSRNKALQLADAAGFHAAKPLVKPFSRTCAEHMSELLDQFICLINLGMQRPKQRQHFSILSHKVFRPTKEKEHRLSCKQRRT